MTQKNSQENLSIFDQKTIRELPRGECGTLRTKAQKKPQPMTTEQRKVWKEFLECSFFIGYTMICNPPCRIHCLGTVSAKSSTCLTGKFPRPGGMVQGESVDYRILGIDTDCASDSSFSHFLPSTARRSSASTGPLEPEL